MANQRLRFGASDSMNCHVFCSRFQFKIARRIVESIAINVMHNLIGLKFTLEKAFHHIAMFCHPVISTNPDVSVSAIYEPTRGDKSVCRIPVTMIGMIVATTKTLGNNRLIAILKRAYATGLTIRLLGNVRIVIFAPAFIMQLAHAAKELAAELTLINRTDSQNAFATRLANYIRIAIRPPSAVMHLAHTLGVNSCSEAARNTTDPMFRLSTVRLNNKRITIPIPVLVVQPAHASGMNTSFTTSVNGALPQSRFQADIIAYI